MTFSQAESSVFPIFSLSTFHSRLRFKNLMVNASFFRKLPDCSLSRNYCTTVRGHRKGKVDFMIKKIHGVPQKSCWQNFQGCIGRQNCLANFNHLGQFLLLLSFWPFLALLAFLGLLAFWSFWLFWPFDPFGLFGLFVLFCLFFLPVWSFWSFWFFLLLFISLISLAPF